MKPYDHLEIIEQGTGKVHEIELADLRNNGPISFGRLPPNAAPTRYIQLGVKVDGSPTDALNWISRYQATVFAAPRDDDSGRWDYYLQDGATIDGLHQPSSNGIYVGDTQLSKDFPTQLRPGPGSWILFKGTPNTGVYSCILQWPAEKEASDDTNEEHPTLSEVQEIKQQRRVYQDQAIQLSQQLKRLGKSMAEMRDQFNQEMNQQSQLLFTMSASLEQEKQLNQQQQSELVAQKKRNRKVRTAIAALSIVIGIVAIIGLGVEVESLENWLNTILVVVSLLGALMGIKDFSGE